MGATSDLVAEARGAVAAVAADPVDADRRALAVLAQARGPRHAVARSLALRARALAAVELGDTLAARRAAEGAMRAAASVGDDERWAQAASTAAAIHLLRGDAAKAGRLMDAAVTQACGDGRADVLCQQVWLRWRLGHLQDAVRAAGPALAEARGRPDVVADVLVNLGCAQSDLGDLRAADASFAEAAVLYEAADLPLGAAVAVHNRTLLLVRRGHVPQALAGFDDVERRLERLGVPMGHALTAQAEALLTANLAVEAAVVARRVVDAAQRSGDRRLEALGWLQLARAEQQQGNAAEAEAAAASAARLLRPLRDLGLTALADHARLRATLAAPNPAALRRLVALAERLDTAGRRAEAAAAHLDVARMAAALGRADIARSYADRLRGGRGRPVLARVQACQGDALARLAAGDDAGAVRAAARGLDLLDGHRALLGATELRAEASAHGAELATVGVTVALRHGRANDVLAAAERWRAGALRRRPVLPADVDDELGRLRRAIGDAAAAVAEGRDPSEALARQAQAEEAVRRRARLAVADEAAVDRLSRAALHAALGERALVELVAHDGHLHAVVVARRRATLHPLGPVERPLAALDHLAFALRRLGRSQGSARALEAAHDSARSALAELDAALVAPLCARLGDRAVVLVPPGDLFAVPWAVLPSLAERPVAVAPSAAWWSAAPAARPGRGALVAGPGLPGAAREVEELGRQYPDATVLTGPAATAAAAMAALDGAALAHLACHGRFRGDNPMFSCLELADGPLTVYDLERLRAAPSLVVLSACDSGVPAVRPGDELLGLVGSLLALGTSAVVASVVPVPDLDTQPLMLAMHTGLQSGARIDEALQRARNAVDVSTPSGYVAATAFACFGAA